jgi:glutamyl-tRNA synthetase
LAEFALHFTTTCLPGAQWCFPAQDEDTDQGRYVPGAEEYIIESLKWAGIVPDEVSASAEMKVRTGRATEKKFIISTPRELVERGHAYYAFDTPDELEQRRQAEDNFTCNHLTRGTLTNSLTLGMEDARSWIEEGRPYVVRLKVEPGREIRINDLVRGEVTIQSGELDDKVLLKADGMPTYHLANVVDDHLMRITHVIRGEEWLPAPPTTVLLYEGFGWSNTMPAFSHLPLILKPVGSGKLSKRDGAKFGMPVFPLDWNGETPEDSFEGIQGGRFPARGHDQLPGTAGVAHRQRPANFSRWMNSYPSLPSNILARAVPVSILKRPNGSTRNTSSRCQPMYWHP